MGRRLGPLDRPTMVGKDAAWWKAYRAQRSAARGAPRPKGRAPAGMVWNGELGSWVPDAGCTACTAGRGSGASITGCCIDARGTAN